MEPRAHTLKPTLDSFSSLHSFMNGAKFLPTQLFTCDTKEQKAVYTRVIYKCFAFLHKAEDYADERESEFSVAFQRHQERGYPNCIPMYAQEHAHRHFVDKRISIGTVFLYARA